MNKLLDSMRLFQEGIGDGVRSGECHLDGRRLRDKQTNRQTHTHTHTHTHIHRNKKKKENISIVQ